MDTDSTTLIAELRKWAFLQKKEHPDERKDQNIIASIMDDRLSVMFSWRVLLSHYFKSIEKDSQFSKSKMSHMVSKCNAYEVVENTVEIIRSLVTFL